MLKSCLMMSPLAAARILPPDERFDCVVMDEASQIRPEDALGVVARAGAADGGPGQVILAGDPRQMPPTRFLIGTPASISAKALPQTLAMEVLPLELITSLTSRST